MNLPEVVIDDEVEGMLQKCAIAQWGDGNNEEIDILRDTLEVIVKRLGRDLPTIDDFDSSSSASRQHFIDTGRYLRKDEVDA